MRTQLENKIFEFSLKVNNIFSSNKILPYFLFVFFFVVHTCCKKHGCKCYVFNGNVMCGMSK